MRSDGSVIYVSEGVVSAFELVELLLAVELAHVNLTVVVEAVDLGLFLLPLQLQQ